MTGKQAKELYAKIEETGLLKHTFARHPDSKKKMLNYLKSQEHVTDKHEYYLRNLCKATDKDIDLTNVEWYDFLSNVK